MAVKIKSYDLIADDELVVASFDNYEQAKDSYNLHIQLDKQSGIDAEEKYHIKLVLE